MTEDEIKILAKWMTEVWKVYCKYLQTEINQWDFDALIAELRIIWENSGRNELVMDMCCAFSADIDRRYVDGK